MNRRQARAYVYRWEVVAKVEAAELRRTSFDDRLRQLVSLFRLGVGLGVHVPRAEDQESDREVMLRWRRLKEAMR